MLRKLGALFLILVISMTSLATPAFASEELSEKKPVITELAKESIKVAVVLKTAKAVVETGAAGAAAVSAATGLTVAATSGAGITSALAAAGGVVGGGMANGPAVLAAGPAYAGAKILNNTLFKDEPNLSEEERDARASARTATNIAATAGVAGASLVTVAGGASGAAIMSTLAGVGSLVGGGAIAGTAIVAAAPVVAAGAIGYAIYKLFGGKDR